MRGICLIPKDDRRKLESRSRKCVFLGYGPDGEIRYRLWDPEHRQIVQSSDVVFNKSAMHKTTKRPIEVRRVIFSEVPTLHEGPSHNTKSVSQVTDNSGAESTGFAQPNDSALVQPTSTPGATNPVIPRGNLLESSLLTPVNRRHTKKHRHPPIRPHGIW